MAIRSIGLSNLALPTSDVSDDDQHGDQRSSLAPANESGGASGEPVSGSGAQTGHATFYTPGVGLSADGKQHEDSELVVAVSSSLWSGGNPNNDPLIGKQINVTGPKGTVTATVTDKLPDSDPNHLDLSQGAFEKIADLDAGDVPITFSVVD